MIVKIFIVLIKLYKSGISPLLGTRCRFVPTCSEYGMQALEKYGPIKGLGKLFIRVLKCNPFGPKGYDPVK